MKIATFLSAIAIAMVSTAALADQQTSVAVHYGVRNDSEQPGAQESMMNGLRHRWNQMSSLWGAKPLHLTTLPEAIRAQIDALKGDILPHSTEIVVLQERLDQIDPVGAAMR